MQTLKIETETVERPDFNFAGEITQRLHQRCTLRIGSKTYDRIVLVYEGQRRVWIRQDGTLHVRRSQPRRGQRHVYTRAMQYIFFSPKIGQFISALSHGEVRMFSGNLRRGRVYGIQPNNVGQVHVHELYRIRRRPWGVPSLHVGDLDRMRRARGGIDAILHLEREYQEAIKGHPLMSKRHADMEPISA
jgi:hypothetical protein